MCFQKPSSLSSCAFPTEGLQGPAGRCLEGAEDGWPDRRAAQARHRARDRLRQGLPQGDRRPAEAAAGAGEWRQKFKEREVDGKIWGDR